MPRPGPSNLARTSRWKWVLYFTAAAGLIAAISYLQLQDLLKPTLGWIGQLGPWGPMLFILIYVVATVLFIPGSVLTLGAGAVFGLARGFIYGSIASTLGATCAFLIGRYLVRDAITRKIEGNRRLATLDQAVATEGWKIVGLTRLSPIFPFTLLNYTFGLTRVKLGHYVVASWIGMMPATMVYAYLGSLATAADGDRQRERTPGEWVLYGVGLLATLLVAILVTRLAKRTLSERLEGS